MRVKIHSLMLGYREADASIGKDEKGKRVLMVEGVGAVPALEYIKQGFKLLKASPAEVQMLKEAGYPMKNEMMP